MKVLIATDGSVPSVDACRLVARILAPDRDELRLVTVLSYHLYPTSLVPGEHPAGEREAAERVSQEVDRVTSGSRRALEEAGFEAAVAHRFGNPPDEITAEVMDWAPDLVVLGRRGTRGLERALGSVSEHVLHHVRKTAVLLVP